MDDVGSLLAEAAVEVHNSRPPKDSYSAGDKSAEKFFGDLEVKATSGNRDRIDREARSRPTGLDILKQAANTVAKEEREDSAHAFQSASVKVNESIEEDYDQTFEDEKGGDSDVGDMLGRISEDIHNNKIEYNGNDIDQDIDRVLQEAAADLDEPEQPPSSPEVSDEEEEGRDEERNKELILAAATGNEKSVRWLLSHGASYRAKDTHGWTPLMWAASKGNEDIMALILDTISEEKLKCHVNKQDELSGWTALHVAAVGGHLKCIKLLVMNKAKNYKKNRCGEIPADGIPFVKSSPEYGACMRALGHEFKAVPLKNGNGNDAGGNTRTHSQSAASRSFRK